MPLNLNIEGAVRGVGKSQGYEGLNVLYYRLGDGMPAMETAWELTPSEMSCILAGGSLRLHILGERHPPVLLHTSAPSDEQDALFAQLVTTVATALWEDPAAMAAFCTIIGYPEQQLREAIERGRKRTE